MKQREALGPAIDLRGDLLRENLRVWRAHGGCAVRAVIKADGYGFGIERVAGALRGEADGFIVTDAEELERLRAISDAPAATLADRGPEHAMRVADLRGIANVARRDSLETLAQRPDASSLTVRVGLRLAAGWSAIESDDAGAFAEIIARASMAVEVWTHLSNPATYAADRERFARFVAVFRERGARIAGEDVASTVPALALRDTGKTIRVGIGLYGSGKAALPALRCAVAVTAPVVDRVRSRGDLRAGYGAAALAVGTALTVLRCGYVDGFPRVTAPYRDILAVGMQYTTVSRDAGAAQLRLLGEDDDLDALAASASVLPHQIVTGLGCGARRMGLLA